MALSIDGNQSKLSAKDKNGDITAKPGLSVSCSAESNQGPIRGKLALAANVSNIRLCTIWGDTYTGQAPFKQSLKGCGSLSGSGPASLAIDADTDEDGSAGFTYTHSDGTEIAGALRQDGKQFTCGLTPADSSALEASLSGIIAEEYDVSVDVDIVSKKCSGKPSKTGDGASFAFGVGFTATDGQFVTTGKSATKGTLSSLPSLMRGHPLFGGCSAQRQRQYSQRRDRFVAAGAGTQPLTSPASGL